MKRRLVLEHIAMEELQESEAYLEGYKTELVINIAFVETDDLKELK